MNLKISEIDMENRAMIPNHSSLTKRSFIIFYNEEFEDELSVWLKLRSPKSERLFTVSGGALSCLFRIARLKSGLHRDTAEKVGLKDPVQIYRNISAAMFQWAGFGVMEVEELAADSGVIVVKDSFECELGKNSATAYSQFVRGIIAGILAELFGRAYNVVEEECIAKGDQVCRFKLKAMPQMRQQVL